MLANNETGVLQAVDALAAQARAAGALFHSDAVQALGKISVDFRSLNAAGVNALTLSAHKIGGPKGAAALVLDKRVEIEPLIAGGGQERGLRSGTENVAAIVGFGVACEWVRRFSVLAPGVCPTQPTLRWTMWMAKRWSVIWTAPDLPWPVVPRVPAPIRSHRMCCAPWELRPNLRVAPCASAWVLPIRPNK